MSDYFTVKPAGDPMGGYVVQGVKGELRARYPHKPSATLDASRLNAAYKMGQAYEARLEANAALKKARSP